VNSPFQNTADYLRRLLQRVELDREALSRPIARCEISTCLGTCCHDGVYLNDDEAALISKLAIQHEERFQEYGLELPSSPIETAADASGKGVRIKTATRPFPMSKRVPDYPEHFSDTNCVFQGEDGRCGLQRLSMDLGEHPWFYKPFTCWIHPLSIIHPPGRPPILTLYSAETDPQNSPDYPGFVSQTGCGKTASCGRPAYEVLREEIEALGEFAGRNFWEELEI